MSIVVRTHAEADAQPQLSYRPPCLAIDDFGQRPTARRQLQLVTMLLRLQPATAPAHPLLATLLASADLETTFLVLGRCVGTLGFGNCAALLDVARQRHGRRAEQLLPAIEESRRQAHLVRLRGPVQDPERRFFLALLLNLPTRRHIPAVRGGALPRR